MKRDMYVAKGMVVFASLVVISACTASPDAGSEGSATPPSPEVTPAPTADAVATEPASPGLSDIEKCDMLLADEVAGADAQLIDTVPDDVAALVPQFSASLTCVSVSSFEQDIAGKSLTDFTYVQRYYVDTQEDGVAGVAQMESDLQGIGWQMNSTGSWNYAPGMPKGDIWSVRGVVFLGDPDIADLADEHIGTVHWFDVVTVLPVEG